LILAQVKEMNTRAIKNIADAEAKEAGIQIDSYTAMANAQASERADSIKAKAGKEGSNGDNGTSKQGGVQPVEAQSSNGEGLPTPEPVAGGLPEPVNPGADIESALSGTNGDADYNALGADIRAEQNTGNSGGGGIPGRAEGGNVEAGKPYVVGEKGQELFVPKQSGTIVPNYGLRTDGTKKGQGWLGELKRPDGKVSTELSIGVNFNGNETEIPALVPTLDQSEIDYLLQGNKPTKAIVQKAVEHAKQRIKQGKSPYVD